MAIYGTFDSIKEQVVDQRFKTAFNYVQEALTEGSEVRNRLLSHSSGTFLKVDLDKDNLALEQVYDTKERQECFFESHLKYIDVQVILDGEEVIEIDDIKTFTINGEYNDSIDLVKYKDMPNSTPLTMKKGYVSIFFPSDAHMPCIKNKCSQKVIKTVVKVKI
ncbi:YhcH/YjgK/YiaL family protein [Allofrancisella inopinata]|nr:YhcH/YjgK/YiaL family protein [Allofrancisella inopinata]TDT68512.1 YhcH/YjgK/YiaL family protein [Allofrancisella inopinata]